VQGRGDSTFYLWRVVFVFGIAPGEDQRAGQIPQQGTLVFWITAELAALLSMSHRSGLSCAE